MDKLIDSKIFEISDSLKKNCPHISSFKSFEDFELFSKCNKCGRTEECWICLKCKCIFCDIEGHIEDHFDYFQHELAFSFSNFSCWCYKCNYFIKDKTLEPFIQICVQKNFRSFDASSKSNFQTNIKEEEENEEKKDFPYNNSKKKRKPKEDRAFIVPSPELSKNAIGISSSNSETMGKWLEPGKDFSPVPKPTPADWLMNYPEKGQSFQRFIKRDIDHVKKGVFIDLIPLGDFPKGRSPSLQTLKEICELYLCVPVRMVDTFQLKPLNDSNVTIQIPSKVNKKNVLIRSRMSERRQLKTGDIFTAFKSIIKSNAYCTLVITMEDLYPSDKWNFVFGEASPDDKIGVFSFARNDPYFPQVKETLSKEEYGLLLLRSLKTMVHEIIHMFNVEHCIYYNCVLGGSNHLEEADWQPLHLCPVDLHKLQVAVGFNIEERYIKLFQKYQNTPGLEKEAEWIFHRFENVLGDQLAIQTLLSFSVPEKKEEVKEIEEKDDQISKESTELEPNEIKEYKLETNFNSLGTKNGHVVLKIALKSAPGKQKTVQVLRNDLQDLFSQAQKKFRLKRKLTRAFSASDKPIQSLVEIEDSSLIFLN